jgi:uncharacterized protein
VPDAARPAYPVAGRIVLLVCTVVAMLSVLTVVIVLPDGTPLSADPGAPTLPLWVPTLPALVGIGLVLLLPRDPVPLPAVPLRRRRLTLTVGALLAIAVALPVTGALLGSAELFVLLKIPLLMVLPGLLVLLVRDDVRIDAAPAAWRWWAPVTVVAVWTLLSQVAPWNPVYDAGGIDPVVLIIGALVTALTAGFGEELFYRRLLQTRLEALLGPGPGIAVASLAFGLMHLGSHGTGDPLLDPARVIALQGIFGLFMGMLWWRYRNFLLIVIAHLISNGWQVAAAFARGNVAL